MTAAMACGQLLVCGYAGARPSGELERSIRAGERAGVILFKRNIPDLEQTSRTLAEITSWDADVLVGVDQEGGRVARLGPPMLALPPAMRLGALDPSRIEAIAELHARELSALGFNWNFAPVLDVHSRAENPIIGDRSFGTNATNAARGACAFARGMRAGGVIACGKHFPGHGDTHTDSHLELPVVDAERARLDAVELAPFRDAIAEKIPSLMTAHVVYPALAKEPATLSRAIATDLLRGELGFDGALVSDDLEMRAIAGAMSVAEAAVRSVDAGCDLLLVCEGEEAQRAAHEALVREHEASPAFRARVAQANARARAMRRRAQPSYERFVELTRSPEARSIERELEALR